MKKHSSPSMSVSAAKTLLILAFFFAMSYSQAQTVASMPFNQSLGVYTPISGGTSLTPGVAYFDDNNFSLISMPFTFVYHGSSFNTIGVSANGYVTLGSVTTTLYNGLTSSANALCPFSADLYGHTDTLTGGNISYVTTGTMPNRVFTVEWKNWGFYSAAANEISFQIKLYETINSIQFVYGNPHPTSSHNIAVGLTGATVTDFNVRTTTTNWAATTAGASNSATCSFSSTIYPASGLTYTWGTLIPSGYAGPDLTVCVGSTATMGALPNSGVWTALSSNPATTTFADDTIYNTTVSGFTAAGSYGYVWTTSLGVDTIIITAPGAGPDQTICQGLNITMAATCTGTWAALSSNPATTTIANSSSAATGVSGFTTAGTYGYVWTVGGVPDTMYVTVNATPSVTVSPASGFYCNSPVQLTASGAVTYSWTGTGLSANNIYNPTASNGGTFVVTGTSANGCTASATAVLTPTGGNTVSGMFFTQSSSTYTAITGGTSLTTTGLYDDNNFSLVTLPFTFTYHGTSFTTIGISANGYAKLGSTTSTSYNATSSQANVLSPFNNDLEGNTANGAKLSYATSGTAPNRVFTIEWKNWGFYSASLSEMSFQIKLYETNNNVQFVYSPSTPATTSSISVGLTGATAADFQTRTGIYGWASTTAGGSNSATCGFSSSLHPASGLTFTWSTGTCNNAYAGPDQTLCNGSTAYMAALAGSGTWTTLSTNPAATTFADDTIYNTTVSGLTTNGAYGFVWTTATGADTVTVHIQGLNAGADQMICQNGTVLMSASCSGTWTALSSNPAVTTFADDTLYNTAITGFTAVGTYGFVWTSGATSDTVYVVVSAMPTITATAASATYCGTPVQLRATGATTYRWIGSGLSSTSIDTPTASPSGVNTYVVIGTTGGCSSSDSVVVSYNLPLSVTATDTIISPCSLVQLNAVSMNYAFAVSSIPYVATSVAGGATTLVSHGSALVPLRSGSLDDGGWSGIPLGFHFNFLGHGYDSINVGTNGVMHFGNYNSSYASQFAFPMGLPNTAYPRNIIAVMACDLYLTTTGSISYWTTGTSPNREFHIYYDSVPGFMTNGLQTAEAILYEASGNVDIQVTQATATSAKTIGLQDTTATIGATAMGRNSYTGTIGNEGWHFSAPGSNTFAWTASGSNPTVATLSSTTAANPTVSDPLHTGSYSYTVTVSSPMTACTASATVSFAITTGCVWPGDADNNMLVDNNDLLPIGLAYDSTGPARSAATIVWVGQSGSDWADTIPGGINFKYADCNGDGVVNAADTTAISLNWGLTHSKTDGAGSPWRSGIPGITIHYSKDTVMTGDTLITSLVLGDSSLTVSNLYGLAFTYNYDALVMDSNSIQFSFTNSWLGNSSNSISLHHTDMGGGSIKAAVTGIDHNARSGSGVIATMRSIITTDNINGRALRYYPNVSFVTAINAVDNHGLPLQLNAGTDSNRVGYTPSGINEQPSDARIRIYPNPAKNNIYISTVAYIKKVDIYDMTGRLINRTAGNDKQALSLDLSAVESGIYTVEVMTSQGNSISKITVNK